MLRAYKVSTNLQPQNAERALKELKLGYLNLSDGFFEQAKQNFDIVLMLDPNCADAFWGQMLAKLEIDNENKLYSQPVKYKHVLGMEECQRALECPDQGTKNKYNDLLERIYQINEGENY